MRRLGSTPAERGSVTGETCPDIFELDDGSFAIIGELILTPEGMKELGGSRGPREVIVSIPRRVLLDAKKDIPDE